MRIIRQAVLNSILLLAFAGMGRADIVVTANTNATQLANAITAGGGAGINVTAATLNGHVANVDIILYPGGVPTDTNVVATSSGMWRPSWATISTS